MPFEAETSTIPFSFNNSFKMPCCLPIRRKKGRSTSSRTKISDSAVTSAEPHASLVPQAANGVSRLGTRILHTVEDAAVDIVFVHGLMPGREESWKTKNQTTLWPETTLPSKIPSARILAFEYDACVTDLESILSRDRIVSHSISLLTSLANCRQVDDMNNRPIIFVAHSLGGLLCAEALLAASQHSERHFRSIFELTRGIMFLGTPHHKSGLAKWAETLAKLAGVIEQTDTQILDALQVESGVLSHMQDRFYTLIRTRNIMQPRPIQIACFFEELPLPGLGVIVSSDYATLPGQITIGINSNHIEMTNFESEEDAGFITVVGVLHRWLEGMKPLSGDLFERHFTVPLSLDVRFVDRNEVLSTIEKVLDTGQRIALHGVGGVGKTQIAIEYSLRYAEKNPQTNIFWVMANSPASIRKAYRDIAEVLKLPGREDPTTNVLNLVYKYLSDPRRGHWLLVLDNADESTMFTIPTAQSQGHAGVSLDASITELSGFLPHSTNGKIIITTQNKDVAHQLVGTFDGIVEVGQMTESQATSLIISRITGHIVDEEARKLVQALEYVPLAITQAAAFINTREPQVTIENYLSAFRKSESNQQTLLNRYKGDLCRDPSVPNAITNAIELSFDQIRQESPSAAEILSLMSLLDKDHIPESLLSGIGTAGPNSRSSPHETLDTDGQADMVDIDFRDRVARLKNYDLITVSPKRIFTMHGIVQLAITEWFGLHGKLGELKRAVIKLLFSAFPSPSHDNLAECRMLFLHVAAVLKYQPKLESEQPTDTQPLESTDKGYVRIWTLLLFQVSKYLLLEGAYNECEVLTKRVLEYSEVVYGFQDADVLFLLGCCYKEQGKYDEAISLLAQIVQCKINDIGVEDETTLKAMVMLASTSEKKGDDEKAEELARLILRVSEGKQPGTGEASELLAVVLMKKGEYDEAEAILRELLEDRDGNLGPDHPETISVAANLAATMGDQDKFDEALLFYQRVYGWRVEHLGPMHPQTLMTLNSLAITACYLHNFELAEYSYRLLWKYREEELGTDHAETLHSMTNLGFVLLSQKKYEEAKVLCEQVIQAQERVLGKDHPDTANSAYLFALVQYALENYDEAVPLFLRASLSFKGKLGATHRRALRCSKSYAKALSRELVIDGENETVENAELEGPEKTKVTKPAQIMFPVEDATPCDMCQGINLENLSSTNGYEHYDSFDELLQASNRGCKLCLLIRDAIMRVAGGNLVREKFTLEKVVWWNQVNGGRVNGSITLRWREGIGFGQNTYRNHHLVKENLLKSVQLCITWNRRKGEIIPDEELKKDETMATLCLYVDPDSWPSKRFPGRRIPVSLRNPGIFEQFANWAEAMLKESKAVYIASTILPTRLIDVGNHNDVCVKLMRTAEIFFKQMSSQMDSRYIALSHCWGRGVPPYATTTSSNIGEDRIRAIRIASLTPNFKDAIALTRRLGIRYIWIDALCIIQDSRDDWEEESAKMGEYYKNSWLTIGGGMSKDGEKGLFGERKPPFEPFCRLIGRNSETSNSYALYFAFDPIEPPSKSMVERLRAANGIYPEWDSEDEKRIFTPKRRYLLSLESALRPRGWVLQEELLSSRHLSFEPSQAYFRCDHFLEFESGQREGLDTDNYLSKGRKALLSGQWEDIIEEYSTRVLTKGQDKLPAVSGLAHEYEKLHPDVYLAGIWQERLLEGLLWERRFRGDVSQFTRPPAYRAPSWSWASVDGPITYSNRRLDGMRRTKILHAGTQLAGSDRMGQVSGGTLTLQGMLVPLIVGPEILGTPTFEVTMRMDDPPPDWTEDKKLAILFLKADVGLLLDFVEGEGMTFRRIGLYHGSPDPLLDPSVKLPEFTLDII